MFGWEQQIKGSLNLPHELYGETSESIFLQVFGKSPEMRLLDFFLDNPRTDYNRTEISGALSMNKQTINSKLFYLLVYELVRVTRKLGKSFMFQLNMENPSVVSLMEMERNISVGITADEDEYSKLVKMEPNGIFNYYLNQIIP